MSKEADNQLMVELLKPSPTVNKLKPTLETFANAFDKELRKHRKRLYDEYNDKDPDARVNQGLGKLVIISEIETIDMVRTSLVDAWRSIGGATRDLKPNE
jgi:hypothetical protein